MRPNIWLESIALRAASSIRGATRPRPHAIEELERRTMLSFTFVAPFLPQMTFVVGPSPTAVRIADLNRDAKPDVIVANTAATSLSVLIGNGDGTFKPQALLPLTGSPSSLAIADVNGDGKPDLLATDQTNNLIDVLTGNGNGTFSAPQTFAAGDAHPTSLTVFDVNRDGKLDLLYANSNDNTVGVMAGNGDGTFKPQSTFATGANPVSISVADANHDGVADLAVANFDASTLSFLLGDPTGKFLPQQTYATSGQPRQVMIGNGTSVPNPSLYYIATGNQGVSTIQGNGDGSFSGNGGFGGFDVPRSIAFADMDNDGTGARSISSPATTPSRLVKRLSYIPIKYPTGASPFDLAIADLNDDGRKDIVVTNNADNTLGVLIADAPPTVRYLNRSSPINLVTSNTATWAVTFSKPVTGVDLSDFTLTTSGATTTSLSISPVSSSVYNVTAGGLGGHGTITLNLADNGSILDTLGNPLQPGGSIVSFSTQAIFSNSFIQAIAATADLNGDGSPDLIAGAGLGVLLGNGDGTFKSANTFYPARAFSIATADVNRDGNLDLEAFMDNGDLFVLPGKRRRHLLRAPATFAGYGDSVAAVDLNGDGIIDLVVNGSHTAPGVMLGNGDGTFQSEQTIANTTFSAMAVGDINGDGRIDLALTNRQPAGTVSVFLGGAQRVLRTSPDVCSRAISHVDRDRRSERRWQTRPRHVRPAAHQPPLRQWRRDVSDPAHAGGIVRSLSHHHRRCEWRREGRSAFQ